MVFCAALQINPGRKLIGVSVHFRRGCVRIWAECSEWIVRQRVSRQYLCNRGIHRNEEGVAWKRSRIHSRSLFCSGHRKNLSSTQNLAESLVLNEIEELPVFPKPTRYWDGTPVCESKLISSERRNSPRANG